MKKEYESIYEIAMSGDGRLANRFIKTIGVWKYADWLSRKIVKDLVDNADIAYRWKTEGALQQAYQFNHQIYYQFTYKNLIYKLEVPCWSIYSVFICNRRLPHELRKVKRNLGNFCVELHKMTNESEEKARKQLLSIIQSVLIQCIYGKQH